MRLYHRCVQGHWPRHRTCVCSGRGIDAHSRGRVDLDDLKVESLSIAPSEVITICLDVTSEEEVDTAVKLAKQHVSSIDVLVDNAGYLVKFKPIGETVSSEWSKSWEINVKGTYFITRAFMSLVLQSSSRKIVNVGSRAALHTRVGASAYGVSKSAVLRPTDYLNFEYKEKGLTALTIHPVAWPRSCR